MSMFYIACEKSSIHESRVENSIQIPLGPRTVEDCEDCPIDYCCCWIEIWGLTSDADISICGFSNGDYSCGIFFPGGNCDAFGGLGEDLDLDEIEQPRVLLCKEKNGVFRIANNTGVLISLKITCQAAVTNPQYELVFIPNGGVVYYYTNSDCEVEEC